MNFFRGKAPYWLLLEMKLQGTCTARAICVLCGSKNSEDSVLVFLEFTEFDFQMRNPESEWVGPPSGQISVELQKSRKVWMNDWRFWSILKRG
jgi:hypothetical protein